MAEITAEKLNKQFVDRPVRISDTGPSAGKSHAGICKSIKRARRGGFTIFLHDGSNFHFTPDMFSGDKAEGPYFPDSPTRRKIKATGQRFSIFLQKGDKLVGRTVIEVYTLFNDADRFGARLAHDHGVWEVGDDPQMVVRQLLHTMKVAHNCSGEWSDYMVVMLPPSEAH